MDDAPRNPHAPLRLLSLDGGGVRGLSSLMVLDDLMENISREEKRLGKRSSHDHTPLKPCDYFDLIGGTSTGGIIAILLGRLQQDVPTCIQIYRKLAAEIFKRDRSIRFAGIKLPVGSTRFSGAVLEEAVKTALRELGYDEDELMWDDTLFEEVLNPVKTSDDNIWADQSHPLAFGDAPYPDQESSEHKNQDEGSAKQLEEHTKELDGHEGDVTRACNDMTEFGPTSNISTNMSQTHARKPTWRRPQNRSVQRKANQSGCRAFVVSALKNALGLPRILATYDPNDRTTRIWEALRATSAAPTFFEDMTFGIPRMTYLDGGVGFNNPCAEVDYAAKSIWEGRPVGVVVSVGTGLQTIPSVKKLASWLPFGLGTDIALATALASMATGTARVDNEMQRTYYGKNTRYYRFDVDGGLENISLEQWMKEDQMASLTEQYMHDPFQVKRARQFGELIVKLSAMPPEFEICPLQFRVGIDGCGLISGEYSYERLDFDSDSISGSGTPSSQDSTQNLPEIEHSQSKGRPGLMIDTETGHFREVYPVHQNLDGSSARGKSSILVCKRCDISCLRVLRTGIPPGFYNVKWAISLYKTDNAPPVGLIFSAGKPFYLKSFLYRYIDVQISPDLVPVLLEPDAVRVRLSYKEYEKKIGAGWFEIQGDRPIEIGLDGAIGLVINKKWEKNLYIGGWKFGGVRLEPVFGDSR